MKNIQRLVLALLACVTIAACTKDISSNTYDTDAIGQASRVLPGVIVSMRNVKIDQNSGVGGIAGAGAGAVAGSAIGGNSQVGMLGAIGGAVIGGLAGNAVENKVNQQAGVEYVIKLDNGSAISTTQASKNTNLHVGQRVLVIYGTKTRIVPDSTASGTWQDKTQTPPEASPAFETTTENKAT